MSASFRATVVLGMVRREPLQLHSLASHNPAQVHPVLLFPWCLAMTDSVRGSFHTVNPSIG
jgi:hypothetical protein